jgi:penicillin V acylase-like amidase (Ntn superfamily)
MLPRGMKRDGRGGKNTISWVSKYGSLIVTAYDIGTADSMNVTIKDLPAAVSQSHVIQNGNKLRNQFRMSCGKESLAVGLSSWIYASLSTVANRLRNVRRVRLSNV